MKANIQPWNELTAIISTTELAKLPKRSKLLRGVGTVYSIGNEKDGDKQVGLSVEKDTRNAYIDISINGTNNIGLPIYDLSLSRAGYEYLQKHGFVNDRAGNWAMCVRLESKTLASS